MKFIKKVKNNYIISSPTEDIFNVIEDDYTCSPEDEYYDMSWDDYKEDEDLEFDSSEEELSARMDWLFDRSYLQEDCMDEMGDTQWAFENAKKLRPGSWLIHFTKVDPRKIVREGFHGADLNHLGLTKGGGKRLDGDHALAYSVKNLEKDHFTYSYYGNHCVLFQAKHAVEAWHRGDDELQTIFHVDYVGPMYALLEPARSQVLFPKGSELVKDVHEKKFYEVYNDKEELLFNIPMSPEGVKEIIKRVSRKRS